MAGNYRNYLKLLESWPLDQSKAGRDLSQHMRDRIKIAFSKGETNPEFDQDQCNKFYMSLHRLASNYHGNKYPRTLNSTSTGLTKEQCNLVLTPEALKILEEDYNDRKFWQLFKFK